MTFTEFMSILNGEYKETAGTTAKNQCVDLANAYIKYVLGLPIIEWTNAVDFPSKVNSNDYEWIANSATNVPNEGDLVIWGGTYGHIAIFIEGDALKFTSFDENYPTGSPCHVQEHNYTTPKVLGWLHPRQINGQIDLQSQLDQCREERDRNWNWFVQLCEALGVGAIVEQAVAEIKKLITLEDSYNQKDKQYQEAQTQISSLQSQVSKLQSDISIVQDQLGVKQSDNEQLQKTVSEQMAKVVTLSKALDDLKKQITTKVYSGWKAALIKLIQSL